MTTSLFRRSGGAILVIALAACTAQPPSGRPASSARAPEVSAPEATEGPAAQFSLTAIVTNDNNLSPEAGTTAAPLTVYRTLAGAAAFRNAQVTPDIPPGFRWAMLTDFDSDDDHEGGHEDRYRSFVAAFDTVADTRRAFEAAVDFHQSLQGWRFTRPREGLRIILTDYLGDEGIHYAVGDDYGHPELSVFLWRRGSLLLQAVDFHPYDRPGLLRSLAQGMDLRAAATSE